MYTAKAIIGKEIIGICIKHEEKESKHNLIDRPLRIKLRHDGDGRTGKWSEAYINKEIEKVETGEVYYSVPQDTQEISKKLKDFYGVDFVVEQKGSIKGNQIFGEFSKLGNLTIVTNHAACHRGQRIPMKCNKFALCYVNLQAEPSYTHNL